MMTRASFLAALGSLFPFIPALRRAKETYVAEGWATTPAKWDGEGPALVCCPHDHADGTPCCGMASVERKGEVFTCPECDKLGVADHTADRGSKPLSFKLDLHKALLIHGNWMVP